MSNRQKPKGNCVFCGHSFSEAGMSKHLKACVERVNKYSAIESNSSKKINLFHLLVQDAYGGDFWLHLEMNGNAKLLELDKYLRAIWLECCGHLSEFSYDRWNDEIAKNSIAKKVFEPGIEIYHIYDFGDSSETKIKVIGEREGAALTKYPIFLMAQNDPPEYACKDCGKKAKWLCLECMYNNEDDTFCDEHIEAHPHEEYGGPIEIVNSPRLGMCGYDGPAKPPY